jgi:hypothetical protein
MISDWQSLSGFLPLSTDAVFLKALPLYLKSLCTVPYNVLYWLPTLNEKHIMTNRCQDKVTLFHDALGRESVSIDANCHAQAAI